MAESSAKLPSSEVIRFGLQITLRLVLATVCGLAFLKIGKAVGHWSVADAVLYAEWFTGVLFLASFLQWDVAYPEFDYGNERLPADNDEAA